MNTSGSLRYEGYPEFAKVLVDIGFLKDEEQAYCKEALPWNEVFQKMLGAASSSEKDLVAAVDSKVTFKDEAERQRILAGLRWLGLFSTEKVRISRPIPVPATIAQTSIRVQRAVQYH